MNRTSPNNAFMLADPCYLCGYFARGGSKMEWDHIEPRSTRGRGMWENIARACSQCNREKKRRTLLMFLVRRRHRASPHRVFV